MNVYSISSIFASIFCISLAILVYLKNKENTLNRSFAIIAFLVGAWALFPFLAAVAKNDSMGLLYVRGVYFAAIFVPSTFLSFVLNLIGKKKTGNEEKVLISSYLLSLVFFALNFTHLLIEDIKRFAPNFYIGPGPAYHLFVIFFGFVCLYAFIKLLCAFKDAKGYQKEQFKYVFIAFIIAYVSGLMHFLPSYFGGRAELFPHDVLLIGFAGIIAYAILRHRLLDIEVVIKRGVAYSLLTALLTGFFVSLILLGDYILRGITGYSSIWAGIIGAFAIALIFQPLRDNIQNLVDRMFFRARYNYQRILGKYSHALAQPMTDLDRFSRIVPYLLTKSMKLSGASVMVLDRESRSYIVRAGERDACGLKGFSVAEDSPLLKELITRKRELALEEIEDLLRSEKDLSEFEKKKSAQIASEMKRLRAVLVIPCISESEYFKKPVLLSTINLGKKRSDESFSREDIGFLKTLANQAAISIEYAFIFEELRKNQERIARSEKLAVIGTTTAGVAHELKNPLTYLSALAQVLPEKWDDPQFKESVGKMLPSEIQRMQLIIEGLLDYSRSRELMLKPLDVKEVIEKASALLNYEIRKNKIHVKTDYRHVAKANADPNRLMQVLMNLMSNAVQAMEEKGGDLSIFTSDAAGEVKISITDTGPGIPKRKLEKIFDQFFTTKETGTGLGLSISKKIIDEHKGSISVDSAPGKGTTFTVCLPAAE